METEIFEVISPNDTFEAIENVPDLVEPACGFFKGNYYKVKKVEEKFIQMIDEFGSPDNFSLNDESYNNYFWKWFKRI